MTCAISVRAYALWEYYGCPDVVEIRPRALRNIPLMRNEDGERLSKRDRSLSMEELRRTCTPAEVLEKISKANDLNF